MISVVGIAPHPPIIIPEIGRGELSKVNKTVQGMKQLSSIFREAEPELLIIITPHGKVMREGPTVLTQELLRGDFGQFGFSGISISMKTDSELLRLLSEEPAPGAIRPVMLGDHDHLFRSGKTLDHGAMVPLYYLREAGVILPGLHVTGGLHDLDELYRFGVQLNRAVSKRGARVAVLASGDLSHRLTPDASAGFNKRGAEFDQLLVDLLSAGRVDDILKIDPGMIEDAGECGLRSFAIALGMIGQDKFEPEIISYEGPFGVGYLVATLTPENSL